MSVSSGTVGSCETLKLKANVSYNAFGIGGGIGSGFTGGTGRFILPNGSSVNVTPADMGTTLVGPVPCGTVQVKPMLTNLYTLTAADIAAGFVTFTFDYTNGISLLPDAQGNCTLRVRASPQQSVTVAPIPTCTVTPAQTVCVGNSASFTATPTGTGPFTFSWRKGCPGAGAVISTNATLSFPSVAVSDAGCYEVTVADRFGCTTTCQSSLTVISPPSCSIAPSSTTACSGSSNQFCVTVRDSGGNIITTGFTISWTKNGNAFAGNVSCISATAPANGVTDTYAAHIVDTVHPGAACVADCTATLTGTQPQACIQVYKQVVCINADGTCGPFSTDLSSQKSASGVKRPDNTQCPAFCYKITVINNSDPGVEIRNLSVTDNSTPDPDLNLAGCGLQGITLAAPGQNGDRASCMVPAVTHCADTVNVVTATGQAIRATDGCVAVSICPPNNGNTVVAKDTNNVTVVPISVICTTRLFSSLDVSNGTCSVTLPADTQNAPISVTLTIQNTGQGDLNVSILGLPPLVDCITQTPVTPPSSIFVAAGQTVVTNLGCEIVSCPAGVVNNISVIGTAVSSVSHPCVLTINGTPVTTAESQCPATVCCATIENIECRVTGGGILLPGNSDQSCIEVPTTISPSVVNGLPVVKITHGGQLGAPFSQMDCGAILGNPCIRGQWSHTRHYGGSGNPRDVVDMDFHSQTPKGVYDSLSCACLGCCDPTTGAFIPPVVGPKVKKFALCNPDDHKICGPQPRPSPANAIIWSGIGTIKPASDAGVDAKKATYVIFRIYIEDRSEPGGNHAGGAVEPADIYCFQAWRTGIAVSKKPDFTSVATAFRTALGQANCDFVHALENGTLPIGSMPSPTVNGVTADIQDCGPMWSGNHQIHPATGATCN